MSQRPTMRKKLNRLRKKLRTPLPVHFNLEEWLLDRRYAQTKGGARKLILAGRVRNGSHTIGIGQMPETDAKGRATGKLIDVVDPIQPVKYKDGLIVIDATEAG